MKISKRTSESEDDWDSKSKDMRDLELRSRVFMLEIGMHEGKFMWTIIEIRD